MAGVGEALKREIAGLVLADQLCLWGFGGLGSPGSDWAGWVRGAGAGKLIMGFAGFLPMCVASRGFQQLSPLGYLDLRMTVGPLAM